MWCRQQHRQQRRAGSRPWGGQTVPQLVVAAMTTASTVASLSLRSSHAACATRGPAVPARGQLLRMQAMHPRVPDAANGCVGSTASACSSSTSSCSGSSTSSGRSSYSRCGSSCGSRSADVRRCRSGRLSSAGGGQVALDDASCVGVDGTAADTGSSSGSSTSCDKAHLSWSAALEGVIDSRNGASDTAHPDATLLEHPYLAEVLECEQRTDWKAAKRVVARMRRLSIQPSVDICNAGMRASLNGRHTNSLQAVTLMQEMLQLGPEPNEESFRIAITACYWSVTNREPLRHDWALYFLEQATFRGLSLDMGTYFAAMYVSRRDWSAAMRLLEHMSATGVQPSLEMYAVAARACQNGGRDEEGLEVLDMLMSSRPSEPDPLFYEASAFACEAARKWQRSLALLQECKDVGAMPTSRMYSSCVRNSAKMSMWSVANRLLLDAQEQGIKLNMEAQVSVQVSSLVDDVPSFQIDVQRRPLERAPAKAAATADVYVDDDADDDVAAYTDADVP